ncbi:hypothetical protein Q5752_006681 [Cryptotrichosporon argae]
MADKTGERIPHGVEVGLPPTNEGYGTQEYWEKRYTTEPEGTSFDWFLSPEYLLSFFAAVDKSARILMLGCGNSRLGEVMYDAGWTNIVNLDYSPAVIAQMRARHAGRPHMEWRVMDVLALEYGEEFDVVVDKGTMDAMLTTKGDPWNPPAADIATCTREVDEAVRVLRKRPGSLFVYFTFGQPHFRKRYLANRPEWRLSTAEIGPPEGFAYYMYRLDYDASA